MRRVIGAGPTPPIDREAEIRCYMRDPDGYLIEVAFRGDVQRRKFIATWLGGGRVLAGMNVNIFGVNDTIQVIVRDGRPVDAGRLAHPDVPLEEFLSR